MMDGVIDERFWSNFIELLNNSEGLSALLDVPVDEISTWRKKVEDGIATVEEREGKIQFRKNKKVLKTDLPDDDDGE